MGLVHHHVPESTGFGGVEKGTTERMQGRFWGGEQDSLVPGSYSILKPPFLF